MSNKPSSNWWSTLPGIMTGIATLITATGSLIVILNTAGFFKNGNYKGAEATTTNTTQEERIQPKPFERNIEPAANSFTPGRYPQSSDRRLGRGDVANVNKSDLKVMRNEIFARHGYIFKSPDMRYHFQNEPWYSPKYDDVTSFLTEIEKENIDLIKRYE